MVIHYHSVIMSSWSHSAVGFLWDFPVWKDENLINWPFSTHFYKLGSINQFLDTMAKYPKLCNFIPIWQSKWI